MSEGAAGSEGAGQAGAEGQGDLGLGQGSEGAGSGNGQDWTNGLSADIRTALEPHGFKGPEDLGKAFLETKQLVGRKGVILPKEGDEADQTRFRKEIGVPEKADQYDLGDFKPPEGVPWDDELQTKMLDRMHKVGVPNSVARDLIREYADVNAEAWKQGLEHVETQRNEAMEALKKKHGSAYEAKLEDAKAALKRYSPDGDLFALRLETGHLLGDHPAVVDFFMNVAESLSEDKLLGEKESRRFTLTPDEAQSKLTALLADEDKAKALYDPMHAAHKDVVEERSRYMRAIHGTESGIQTIDISVGKVKE